MRVVLSPKMNCGWLQRVMPLWFPVRVSRNQNLLTCKVCGFYDSTANCRCAILLQKVFTGCFGNMSIWITNLELKWITNEGRKKSYTVDIYCIIGWIKSFCSSKGKSLPQRKEFFCQRKFHPIKGLSPGSNSVYASINLSDPHCSIILYTIFPKKREIAKFYSRQKKWQRFLRL